MSLNFSNVSTTVTTVAAPLISIPPGVWCVLQNTGANPVFVGGPTVASSGAGLGVSIAAGASLALEPSSIDVQNLWAVTGTLTSVVVALTPGN
jgi:hypothetical protein